jgi:hypothetical protein
MKVISEDDAQSLGEQKTKFIKAASIAFARNASMPTTAEILVRIGCPYNEALDITLDVFSNAPKATL